MDSSEGKDATFNLAMTDAQSLKSKVKKSFFNTLVKDFKKNQFLLLLTLPMVVYTFIFHYMPMAGAVIAFKKFRYDKGIFGSDWVGLKNFKFFFTSQDAWRITRNTLAYNIVFIILGLIIAVALALLLNEIYTRTALKVYQTVMFFPHFLSWVVVAYILYAFLNPRAGILNQVLDFYGLSPLDWYTQPKQWIIILPVVQLWKSVGMSTLMYYASLIGIDYAYYEAASLEGASRWQMIKNITLPFLYPLMTILTILNIGHIFRADFGLFYQLPMDSAALYSTTDVIDTYVFRALKSMGNIEMSSAAGLYESFVGFVLVVITNYIVKKFNPENALY